MLNVFRGVLVDTVGSSERVPAVPWVLQSLQQTQKCFTWTNGVGWVFVFNPYYYFKLLIKQPPCCLQAEGCWMPGMLNSWYVWRAALSRYLKLGSKPGSEPRDSEEFHWSPPVPHPHHHGNVKHWWLLGMTRIWLKYFTFCAWGSWKTTKQNKQLYIKLIWTGTLAAVLIKA